MRVSQAREARIADLKALAEQIQHVPPSPSRPTPTRKATCTARSARRKSPRRCKGKNLQVEPDMVQPGRADQGDWPVRRQAATSATTSRREVKVVVVRQAGEEISRGRAAELASRRPIARRQLSVAARPSRSPAQEVRHAARKGRPSAAAEPRRRAQRPRQHAARQRRHRRRRADHPRRTTSTPTPTRKSSRPSSPCHDQRPPRRPGARWPSYLKQQKQIEDIGGYAYLAELWDAAPTAANAEYYARIVRDKAIVRNLIHASTEILRDAYDQASRPTRCSKPAERKILDIAQMGITGQTITLQEAMHEAYDRIDTRTQHGPACRSAACRPATSTSTKRPRACRTPS